MRQQARAGHPAQDRTARCGHLHDAVTAGAGFFTPDVANHLERCVDDFQLFRDIFTEWLEATTALRTGMIGGFEDAIFARQFGRQGLPRWRRALRRWHDCRRLRIDYTFFGQQIFQPAFQLLDLPIDLLGFATELHALQFGNQQFKLFDFQCP